MAGIVNINSTYNVNTKKMFSKLSFEVGQIFLARIVNLDKLTGEILLKLLDGWQFSAKLEKGMDTLPEGLIKFQVEGFEDGNLQLNIVSSDNKKNKEDDSIDFLLKNKSIGVDKEDYVLLNKMIKHEMPLTKENISNIKTIVDFMSKIKQNPEEQNTFINKYIESKNIPVNSARAQEIKETLKGFFTELSNIGEDDVLTLVENNIELTEKNIKSFNNIFKKSGTIYNEIKDIKCNDLNISGRERFEEKPTKEPILASALSEEKKGLRENNGEKVIYKNISESITKDTSKDTSKDISKVEVTNKNENINKNKTESKIDNNIENKSIISSDEDKKVLSKEIEIDTTTKETTKAPIKHSNADNIEKIIKSIKDQISQKTQEMKNTIKTVLEQKSDVKSESYNNIVQALDKNINDFKVFNSISNSYYYLDLPLEVDNAQYKCKLMIKDERKKGKKIDSSNVKIAASVVTNNMGVVDAYIKVSNVTMDIDIKCDNEWIKTLENGKEKFFKELSNIGYNINMHVDKKNKEMNIVNCREFFEDNNLGVINTKA